MFETLQRLYTAGKLSKANVAKAVVETWITADQYKMITGEDYIALQNANMSA